MSGSDSLHSIELIVLFLLVLVAVFATIARRINIPYPILLVLAGLGVAFLPHVPRIPLNPEIFFVLFLPPLLYSAAWQTHWREFKRNLVSIVMLAIGLVGFTVWGVAMFADRFITVLDFKSGLILGAVVCTTDAIAAASIAKAVRLPQRITDLLEGESLVNDATGLVALEFGLSMLLRGEMPTPGGAALRFLWLVGGGLVIGLLIGLVTAWIERWIDDGPIEMVIAVIVPYVAYLAGESIHASGVIAVVTVGLYLSRRRGELFSPSARLEVLSTWKSLDFVLNGIVFVLIGLQLPYVLSGIGDYSRWTLIEYGIVFSFILIFLRMLWMYPGAVISYWIRTHLLHQVYQRPAPREIFVIGWTGMRGVLALAAAFSLPLSLGNGRPFAQRNLIIFLTFSIILTTLVLQGLTLPALIRYLGLAGKGGASAEQAVARRTILSEAVAFLQSSLNSLPEGADYHGYEDLLHRYEHRLEAVGGGVNEDRTEGAATAGMTDLHLRRSRLAQDTIAVERSTLLRLRDEGAIGDDALHEIERELDLTETPATPREINSQLPFAILPSQSSCFSTHRISSIQTSILDIARASRRPVRSRVRLLRTILPQGFV